MSMNNNPSKLKSWLPIWVSLSLIVGMFLGFKMRDNFPDSPFFVRQQKSVLREVEQLIKKRYVDEVDMNRVGDTAIAAVLSMLDPHSVYIPAHEVDAINDDIHGQFVGIGIEFLILKDTVNLIRLMPGSPAEKAGLQIGDKLIKADQKSLIAMPEDSVRNYIKGKENSQVTLTLIRGGSIKKIGIKRGRIPVNSIDASYVIEKSIGYIRISKFSTETYREFMTALMTLKKQGISKLILDLRGNSGGILNEAVEIADEFLSGDKLITYTEGKHQPKKEYRCKREGQFEKGELVVLSDEESASASEILMGALQDWDRATIMGTRSFGKGLVQEQYDLSNHAALRLTIARYYTPVGRSIQRSYQNGYAAYYENLVDSNDTAKGKEFRSANGKKLYDGGGIYPDVLIKQDSLWNASFLFLKDHQLNINTIAYLSLIEDQNAKSKEINLPDSINSFISKLPENQKKYLSQLIKANLTRMREGTEAYHKQCNQFDPVVNSALVKLNHN
jgi:carboxyl-terminal processing protease